jgi:uncharacterized membrane protein
MLTPLAILTLLGSALIAGVFFAFSSFVMAALKRLPPDQGHAAMRHVNITVINWHFLGAFMGTALVAAALIVVTALNTDHPGAVLLITGAALYLVGTFFVTIRFNVPLNNRLEKTDPEDPGGAEQWESYLRVWTRWNHVRTAAAFLAAAAICIGLVQGGG